MSDNAQIIVDVDGDAQHADGRANVIRGWLISEGIVARAPGNCGLVDLAHPPGPHFRKAVSTDDTMFLALKINGVAILSGRRVFDTGSNGIALQCECGHVVLDCDPPFLEAVAAWADGDDKACHSCPRCREQRPLVEWRGPKPWAFGHLGFTFWNWPPLSEEFIQAIAQRLGHRTVLIHRHL